jgi:hypothetical protein
MRYMPNVINENLKIVSSKNVRSESFKTDHSKPTVQNKMSEARNSKRTAKINRFKRKPKIKTQNPTIENV